MLAKAKHRVSCSLLLGQPDFILHGAQILSLHNCAKISGAGLAALGRSCPQLHMLLLGGCTLAPSLPSGYQAPHQPAATEGPPSPRAAGPLRVIGVVDEGQYIPGARSGLQMLREAVEGSGAGRAGVGAAAAGAVEVLCGIVRALPHLRVLELTHFSAAVVDGVRALCSATGVARSLCACRSPYLPTRPVISCWKSDDGTCC